LTEFESCAPDQNDAKYYQETEEETEGDSSNERTHKRAVPSVT